MWSGSRESGQFAPRSHSTAPPHRVRWVLLTPGEVAALDLLVFLSLSLGTRRSSATQEAMRGLRMLPKLPMVEDLFTS